MSAPEGVPADKVVLSVRPEDIYLSELRPDGENVWQGTVDQKVFLGESADFQVAIGERRLQSRVHPSLVSARWVIGVPLSLKALQADAPGDGEDAVIFDNLGAGVGQRTVGAEGG